jgi:hypothetical protein
MMIEDPLDDNFRIITRSGTHSLDLIRGAATGIWMSGVFTEADLAPFSMSILRRRRPIATRGPE